jgi:predicted nucleic acid-binding protein
VNAVFADTSFFLALLREDDPAHAPALALLMLNQPIVTTEFILLELGNACARGADHADFLAQVAGMRTSPRIRIIPLDSRLLNRGFERMRDRPDKDWSLTDCISFAVMEEEGIQEALTADRHFEQAGFTALLKSV